MSNPEDIKSPSDRRAFFKRALMIIGAGAAVQFFGKAEAFAATNLKPMTDPTCKGPASGFGYVDNLVVALKQKKISKSVQNANGKTWKTVDQRCQNCSFFGMNRKPKDHSCQIMPGCAVNPKGSCNEWSAKS